MEFLATWVRAHYYTRPPGSASLLMLAPEVSAVFYIYMSGAMKTGQLVHALDVNVEGHNYSLAFSGVLEIS